MGNASTSYRDTLSINDINALVATTTSNTFTYLNGVLPTLLVFGVIIGILFMSLRWLWSAIRGHGHRP